MYNINITVSLSSQAKNVSVFTWGYLNVDIAVKQWNVSVPSVPPRYSGPLVLVVVTSEIQESSTTAPSSTCRLTTFFFTMAFTWCHWLSHRLLSLLIVEAALTRPPELITLNLTYNYKVYRQSLNPWKDKFCVSVKWTLA